MIYPAGVVHRPFEPITLGQSFTPETWWQSKPESFAHRFVNLGSDLSGPASHALGQLGRTFVGWLPGVVDLEYSVQVTSGPTPPYEDTFSFRGIPRPFNYQYSNGVENPLIAPNDSTAPNTWLLHGTSSNWAYDFTQSPAQWVQKTYANSIIMTLHALPQISVPRRRDSGGNGIVTYDASSGWGIPTWAQPGGGFTLMSWSLSTQLIYHY